MDEHQKLIFRNAWRWVPEFRAIRVQHEFKVEGVGVAVFPPLMLDEIEAALKLMGPSGPIPQYHPPHKQEE